MPMLPDSALDIGFDLTTPIRVVLSGAHGERREDSISSIVLRQPTPDQMMILDRYRGQPVKLLVQAVAALSGLTIAQVKRLDLCDFERASQAALRSLSRASDRMGLPSGWFLDPALSPAP
ncbi:phage tail assembly protein [Sphingomonas sp. RP10(2022)]|uniref:Phage tail assembly protein n=2 Tax=Sphingomonas liriopis TaxID=2949094 RepID=A0A9X2HYX9_9SPHN|nr:phage tail assembly protein [Sphingomonas liriopis]